MYHRGVKLFSGSGARGSNRLCLAILGRLQVVLPYSVQVLVAEPEKYLTLPWYTRSWTNERSAASAVLMYELFKELRTHIDPSGEVELADDALERLCCAAVGSGSSGFGGWSASMALGRGIFSGKKRVDRQTQRASLPTHQERRNSQVIKRTGRTRVAVTPVFARVLSGKGVVSYLMLQLPDDDSLIGGVRPGIHGTQSLL